MILSSLYIAGGLVLLTGGADGLVRGAASLARRLGLSPLLIGLTVVAVGTSLPELLVSLSAALRGSGAIALGNVVGSNISNLALILGISALIIPIHVQAQIVRIDAPILLAASVALVVMTLDGTLGRIDGGLLTIGIVAYVVFSVYAARKEPRAVHQEYDAGVPDEHAAWVDALFLIGGLVGLLGGAHLLVEGAVAIATSLGASEMLIGLTVVAVGTSLPELATSVAAARRGEGDIAVGNAIGSSIFNVLGILGITVLVQPIATSTLSPVDAAVFVGLSIVIVPLMYTRMRLSRREGVLLTTAYVAYVAWLVVG